LNVLWLSDGDVRDVLTMEEALLAVEESFREHGEGKVQMPPKIYLGFENGDLRAMPAYLVEQGIAGVKIVNVHPGNPSKGLPTVIAILVLNDPETGAPLSVMDATYITDMRTGAAGGIAAKYLSRADSKVLGLVGAGRQAQTQLLAISKVRELELVKVASKSIDASRDFKEKMEDNVDCEVMAVEVKEACDCDILATTTPVRKPIIKKEWVRKGTHINAIGADALGKEELDPELLIGAKIVVDDITQAIHSGEVNVPLSKGLIQREDIRCELGKVILGECGRERRDEITIFDSTGLAIQDVMVGKRVFEAAMGRGLGKKLRMF
jgi:alanine dehydrogenase